MEPARARPAPSRCSGARPEPQTHERATMRPRHMLSPELTVSTTERVCFPLLLPQSTTDDRRRGLHTLRPRPASGDSGPPGSAGPSRRVSLARANVWASGTAFRRLQTWVPLQACSCGQSTVPCGPGTESPFPRWLSAGACSQPLCACVAWFGVKAGAGERAELCSHLRSVPSAGHFLLLFPRELATVVCWEGSGTR